MKSIPFNEFNTNIFKLWDKEWFLLTGGDYEQGKYNTMTVSWGYFGIMWNKPTAVVVVRPVRHTFQFIDKYDSFTLTAFSSQYHQALKLLGTISGRDGDKITKSGLTIQPAVSVAAPTFKEAELVVECRKVYWDDYKPEHFLDPGIEKNYPHKDYHRIYYGEILNIRGTEKFR